MTRQVGIPGTRSVIVEAACSHVPVPRDAVGPDGLIIDTAIREQLLAAVNALMGAHDTASASA